MSRRARRAAARALAAPSHARVVATAPALRAAAALATGALCVTLPLPAVAQDLRYGITPTAQQVSWDDALGLDNTLLYGGRAGLVLGRRIELQGFYLTNEGTDSGIRDLYDRLNVTDRPPQNPGLGVRNYGAALVYNFSVGGFTPFVRGGGSILRFEPEGGRASDRIALSYGGGLRFGKPGGLRFNVFAEDLRFRTDRTLLLALPRGGVALPDDAQSNRTRSNLTYGAGLTIPLGGGAVTYDDTPQYQLSNVALPVDVFAGRLDFASSSGLPNQNLLGVRTGIDFGPLFGLRAFYWTGVSSGFDSRAGLQGYGGEAQFALNAGPGISPFLVAGAAQLDFRPSYRINDASGGAALAVVPDDRTALILGGGLRVPLGTRLTLTAAARNYLAARGGVVTADVSERSQLNSNWQFTAGLSFGIGGRGLRRRTAQAPARDTVFVDRSTGRRVDVAAGEVEAVRGNAVDRFVVTTSGDTLRGARADSVLARDPDARVVEVRRAGRTRFVPGDAGTGYASDRTVEIVVPTEGEINIRYGPQTPEGAARVRGADGALLGDRETLRGLVREELARTGAAPLAERTLLREYRDGGGRVVREYRQPDNRVVREYTDGAGRVVREYRAPNGTLRREFVPLPVAPPAAAPAAPVPPSSALPRVTPYGAGGEVDLLPEQRPMVQKQGVADATLPSDEAARADALEAAVAARAGGASPVDVRALVREELARDARQREAQLEQIRMEQTRLEQNRLQQEAAMRADVPARDVATTTVVSEPPRRVYGAGGVQGGLLYSGATVSTGRQALVGGRIDFGALSPRVPGFRLVPELAFGFGAGGTSFYGAANAMYEIGPIFRVRPRVALGAGLLNFREPVGGRDGLSLVVTPSYGVSLPLDRLRLLGRATPELVVEHQGIDFFDVNRLVVGLGWRR